MKMVFWKQNYTILCWGCWSCLKIHHGSGFCELVYNWCLVCYCEMSAHVAYYDKTCFLSLTRLILQPYLLCCILFCSIICYFVRSRFHFIFYIHVFMLCLINMRILYCYQNQNSITWLGIKFCKIGVYTNFSPH